MPGPGPARILKGEDVKDDQETSAVEPFQRHPSTPINTLYVLRCWIHLDPSRPAQKRVGCKHTRNLTQQSGIHSVRSSTLQIRVHVDCGRLLGNFHLARDLRVAFGQLTKMLLQSLTCPICFRRSGSLGCSCSKKSGQCTRNMDSALLLGGFL